MLKLSASLPLEPFAPYVGSRLPPLRDAHCRVGVFQSDAAAEESQTDGSNREQFHIGLLYVSDRKKLSLLTWQFMRVRDFQHLS